MKNKELYIKKSVQSGEEKVECRAAVAPELSDAEECVRNVSELVGSWEEVSLEQLTAH